jgi:transposase
MNVLDEQKKQQVLGLGRLGWSLRRIEQATGVRRETASAYLKASGIAVRRRGGQRGEWTAKPAIKPEVSTDPERPKPATTEEVSTDSGRPPWPAPPGRAPRASACEPFREVISEALGRGRNAMAIWQDLVDDHGFRARYASVKRFVLKLRGSSPAEARVVITTAPGEEAQVDYGEGPMVRDANTGKYRRTRLFVMTLGYSRKSVRLIVARSSAQVWAELHERAFRRLGGTVRVLVLDNLREGVIAPDVYDPTLNPLYRDVLAYYGVVALPCRVRDPDRKGKVESAVGHAQKTPLKGLRFETLEEAQAYLDRWEEHWADTRIHGTTKRQVSVMFAEEKPALRELPLEPFRYYRYGQRTVNLDGCVEVEAAYYSAPPGWIGRQVQVQWDELRVRVLAPSNGSLLREHLRTRRGFHRIPDSDLPPRTPRSTEALLRRAYNAGDHIGTLCEQIHRTEGQAGVRRILGVLALARKHGPAVVDDAALAALELRVPSYRFVRRYLERRPSVPVTLRQVDPLIRQLTLYRDLIDHKTGDPT